MLSGFPSLGITQVTGRFGCEPLPLSPWEPGVTASPDRQGPLLRDWPEVSTPEVATPKALGAGRSAGRGSVAWGHLKFGLIAAFDSSSLPPPRLVFQAMLWDPRNKSLIVGGLIDQTLRLFGLVVLRG